MGSLRVPSVISELASVSTVLAACSKCGFLIVPPRLHQLL